MFPDASPTPLLSACRRTPQCRGTTLYNQERGQLGVPGDSFPAELLHKIRTETFIVPWFFVPTRLHEVN